MGENQALVTGECFVEVGGNHNFGALYELCCGGKFTNHRAQDKTPRNRPVVLPNPASGSSNDTG